MSNQSFPSYEQAIETMRTLTSQGKAFSVRYCKADGSTGYVDRAQLGRMNSSGNKKHILPFLNLENKERRSVHITGLMEVNHIKIKLQR
ncbi:hypothetical protein [Leeuwenhoekiella sp. CH_XMU1409-2]|uniref:hypothetical protein n=1 Tax=Leeuwenhoekiella sp. CH_XMU1409-2 TaxID=3107768 RepID=UPI003009105D